MQADRHFFNPPGVRAPFGHYHHGVEFSADASSTWLLSSGQLGMAPDDTIPESVTAQARLCFQAIQNILAEAEMNFADVLKLSAFVTDRAFFKDYMAVRDEFIVAPEPTSTLMIVSGFTRPEFKVEVEVMAMKGARS